MSEKNQLDGISAPILEETTYNANDVKKKTLDDIQAPVLEDTFETNLQNKKVGLADISAPILEDTFVSNEKKKSSLEGISAPILDAQDFTPPVKKVEPTQNKTLEQVSAPVLSEESTEEHKPYVSKYSNVDIEKAKQEGAKKARKDAVTTPELTEEEKKKSREAYKSLMRQREEDMAKKGGKMVILLLFLGLFTMVGFHLLISVPVFKEGGSDSLVEKLKGFLWYYDALIAIGSFLLLPKIEGFKNFASFVFGLNTLVSLTLGSFLLSQMESIGINIVFYLVSLLFSGFIVFQLSSNENIGKYYSRSTQY